MADRLFAEADRLATDGLLDDGAQARYGDEVSGDSGRSRWDILEPLPWWRTPSVYWLLLPLSVMMLASGAMIVPKLDL
ncbi:hypothetical protein CDD83_1599 [Cordyceps sp. RAO-2017]|nr:hypothetical protein CDD83_1599 [Cordyceps sp. RAO-2017]